MGKTYRQQRDFEHKPRRLDHDRPKRYQGNSTRSFQSLYDGDDYDVLDEDFEIINNDIDES